MQKGDRRSRLRLVVHAFYEPVNNDQTASGWRARSMSMTNSATESDSLSVSVVAARALLNSGGVDWDFAATAELIAISLVVTKDSS